MARARGARHTTRPFAVGSFAFVVATSADDDRALVESVFLDLPRVEASGDHAHFELLRKDAETWTITGPRLNDPALPLDGALKQLLTAVNLCALDAEPEFLHLHAAAATKNGEVAVMAAPRDTGKTTTVAHLLARAWGFVTDETVRLSTEPLSVTGFPKPLSIKPGSRGLVAHLDRWMIPPTDADDRYVFVPITATGGTVVEGGPPRIVVLLQRVPEGGAATPTQYLHPADAVVALMQDTIDAERFGAASAALGARLVAGCHCVALTMGTPRDTVDEIESLFGLRPPAPLDVSVFPTSGACSPGVTTVGIGDRVVVHNTVTGQIFALDEGGTRVWLQLGGWSTDDTIDVDGPVIAPFVTQLRSFGILEGAR